MKDALGHGSNPRGGAHSEGIEQNVPTHVIQEGTKVMATGRGYKSKIVPAWRVAGPNNKQTNWTSVRGEAEYWLSELKAGRIPSGSRYQ